VSHESIPRSVLVTAGWWRTLGNRLGRQFSQTVLPILAVLTADPSGTNLGEVAVATVGALTVTLVKAGLVEVTGIHPTEGTALGWRLLDRCAPAAAGVLAGLWPTDTAGLLTFDGRRALAASAGLRPRPTCRSRLSQGHPTRGGLTPRTNTHQYGGSTGKEPPCLTCPRFGLPLSPRRRLRCPCGKGSLSCAGSGTSWTICKEKTRVPGCPRAGLVS